jgi:hypothetical protein
MDTQGQQMTDEQERLHRIYRMAHWADSNVTNLTLDEWQAIHERIKSEVEDLLEGSVGSDETR